jgi:hypothetical protein
MPTLLTCGVADGTVTSFSDYAWIVARQFGAIIHLRDEPLGAYEPVPREPSTYHKDVREEYEDELDGLNLMTESELADAAEKDYQRDLAEYNKRKTEIAETRKRYEDMLVHASAYEPPTPLHVNFAKMMVDQLIQSIEFDCMGMHDDPPCRKSTLEWVTEKRQMINEYIMYHSKEWHRELKRVSDSNNWVYAIKQSLKQGE